MQLLTVLIVALAASPPVSISDANLADVAQAVYAEHGTDGSFLLYDEHSDEFVRYNAERTRRSVSPASTSKILNALIALEEAVLADENEVVPWDGVERQFSFWNSDQTLTTAVQRSAVWVFQHVARQAGRNTMQYWLDKVGYGNGLIGDDVDQFWLDGSLQISPEQQIHFLRRLRAGDLPFSARNQDIVRRILVRDTEPGYVLRAKTGWVANTQPNIGWYVGWVERANNVWYFALNVDIHDDGRGRDRPRMLLAILRQLGIIPAV